MRRGSLAVLCLLLAPALAFAQPRGSSGFKRYEINFGLGGASSPEKSIFNLPSDSKSEPELAINLAGRMNLDEHFAVGLHVYGATEETDTFTVVKPGGSAVATTFELDTYNFGAHVRYTLLRGAVQPYATLGLSIATGVVSSATTGDLNYSGVTAVLEPGLNWWIVPAFAVGGEVFVSIGGAHWEQKPFSNSRSDGFDPSLTGVLINLSFAWGGHSAGNRVRP